jgi:hypothetical protein
MLKIREKQLEELDRVFEEKNIPAQMAAILTQSFPVECDKLGQEGLMRRVARGRELAGKYGIRKFPNVVRYINLMFVLEREDFDTAEETAWAGTILNWYEAEEELKLAALEKRCEMEFAKKQGFM